MMASRYGGPSHGDSPSFQPMPTIGEEEAKASLTRFGSPYATNAHWSPSQRDAHLSKLPSLAITMRIQQRFARQAGDIFNPPCPSFQRPVWRSPRMLPPFAPIRCKGKGEMAGDGFEAVYPGLIMTQHDVSSADWFRFLQDLDVAGRLSGVQEAIAGIAPITMHLGATGFLVTKLIKKSMARKKEPLIFETVEVWNASFFAARRLDVYIHNGKERVTATQVGGMIPPLDVRLMTAAEQASEAHETQRKSEKSERREKKKGKCKEKMFLVIAPRRDEPAPPTPLPSWCQTDARYGHEQ